MIIDINSVRWDANGELLVTASDDYSAKVVDFKTSKVIWTVKSLPGKKPLGASDQLVKFFSIGKAYSACFL